MLNTILVPLDGSSLAERALPFAIRISRATGARLLLVRTGLAGRLMNLNEEATAALAAAQQAEQDLTGVAERLQASGVQAEVHVHLDDATRTIVRVARDCGAGLIVMTTHGRSGLGRWVYGSIAEQVLRRAPVPVLLVPAGCDPVWPEDRPLRIIVPLDGSRLAAAVLEPASELAGALRAEIVLLGVVEPPRPAAAADAAVDAQLTRTLRYLNRAAARLRAHGQSVVTEARAGDPGAVIATVRREYAGDLLVLSARGRGRTHALPLGHVVASLIQRSMIPILLVRPAALSRAREGVDAADEVHPRLAGRSASRRARQPDSNARTVDALDRQAIGREEVLA
jgi:nucleotide-binding universal stress UspA family protein